MAHTKISNTQNVAEPPSPPATPATVDLENGVVDSGGVLEIVQRWKREKLLNKCALVSRGFGFVCSFLAFIIMASNKHGDWEDFDTFKEYQYLLAITVLSTLYTCLQSLRQIRQLSTGREVFSGRKAAVVDFFGDQIMAYLLISAASSAIPRRNEMREFLYATALAIYMGLFTFSVLAFSSLVSGYKLCNQSYI